MVEVLPRASPLYAFSRVHVSRNNRYLLKKKIYIRCLRYADDLISFNVYLQCEKKKRFSFLYQCFGVKIYALGRVNIQDRYKHLSKGETRQFLNLLQSSGKARVFEK